MGISTGLTMVALPQLVNTDICGELGTTSEDTQPLTKRRKRYKTREQARTSQQERPTSNGPLVVDVGVVVDGQTTEEFHLYS